MLERRNNSEIMRLRLPAELQSAVVEVAARDCISASAFVRQTLTERLRREGVALAGADVRRRKA